MGLKGPVFSVMETSKVQVEYNDPFGIYHSIETDIRACFPLRNLHWHSSSRPLRSIQSLHVDLVPDPHTHLSHSNAGSRPGSNEVSRTSNSADGGSKRERRHQIPGLRQTPYLRIFFLHCDDVDSYKSNCRAQVRDWILKQSSSSRSATAASKQEKHDAFEWLVVLVDGGRLDAERPGAKNDADNAKKSGSSRWKSRSSKTVIEKLRSDVSAQSKQHLDRVTQINVHRTDKENSKNEESSDTKASDLSEFVGKMKTLILASFDLRVQQYEEDIREKEQQRSLPGWNFNTFFVLKEGLARDFESVGLVEDALSGYQELAIGLEAVIADHADIESYPNQTSQFQSYTDDLQRVLFQALNDLLENRSDTRRSQTQMGDIGSLILDTDRKPFRSLILENNISVYDFGCYVFARQVSLLFRQANAHQSRSLPEATSLNTSESPSNESQAPLGFGVKNESQLLLVKICELSLSFLGGAAWQIRCDLMNSKNIFLKENPHKATIDSDKMDEIIDNLTASWIFSACESILHSTTTASLQPFIESSLRRLRRSSSVDPASQPIDAGDSPSDKFPRRTSSLLFRSPSTENLPNEGSGLNTNLPETPDPPRTEVAYSATIALAGARGELLSLARRTLSSLAMRVRGWLVGSDAVKGLSMEDVDLQGESPSKNSQSSSTGPQDHEPLEKSSALGVTNHRLNGALKSLEDFTALYEDLTVHAMSHFMVGERGKMVEATSADLAVLYHSIGDHDVAVSYFKQLTPFYGDKKWTQISSAMLEMWSISLRKLGRVKESIVVAMRAVESQQSSNDWTSCHNLSLQNIIEASKSIDGRISVPVNRYFAGFQLAPVIDHTAGRDSFEASLRLQNNTGAAIQVDEVLARIRRADSQDPCDIKLHSEGNQVIKRGFQKLSLISQFTAPGWYELKGLSIAAGNVFFELQDEKLSTGTLALPDATSHPDGSSRSSDPSSRLLVWSQSRSLQVDVRLSDHIDLPKPRSVIVRISSGWNDIAKGHLILRPHTAGLRLHTAQARILTIGQEVRVDDEPVKRIRLGPIAADEEVQVVVPFDLEDDVKEIKVSAEVKYATDSGEYYFKHHETIPLGLLLAVNVQDTFHKDALFSRFTIGSATAIPIHVLGARLVDSRAYKARLFPVDENMFGSFTSQPVSLVAEIRRKQTDQSPVLPSEPHHRLHLSITYIALDARLAHDLAASLTAALTAPQRERYGGVLDRHLKRALKGKLSARTLEVCGMLEQFEVGKYEDWGWDTLLSAFDPDEGRQLEGSLRSWHMIQTQALRLSDVGQLSRELTVPVDVPEIQVLHTVRMRLIGDLKSSCHSTMVTVGQGLCAELSISHTRHWRQRRQAPESLDFRYQLHADLEAWLVGGQRSASFSAKENEVHRFTLLLIPQKTGHLLFPTISVEPYPSRIESVEQDDKAVESVDASSCEVDYTSQAETVLVLPAATSQTTKIDFPLVTDKSSTPATDRSSQG